MAVPDEIVRPLVVKKCCLVAQRKLRTGIAEFAWRLVIVYNRAVSTAGIGVTLLRRCFLFIGVVGPAAFAKTLVKILCRASHPPKRETGIVAAEEPLEYHWSIADLIGNFGNSCGSRSLGKICCGNELDPFVVWMTWRHEQARSCFPADLKRATAVSAKIWSSS